MSISSAEDTEEITRASEPHRASLDFFDLADVSVEQRCHRGRANLADRLARAALSIESSRRSGNSAPHCAMADLHRALSRTRISSNPAGCGRTPRVFGRSSRSLSPLGLTSRGWIDGSSAERRVSWHWFSGSPLPAAGPRQRSERMTPTTPAGSEPARCRRVRHGTEGSIVRVAGRERRRRTAARADRQTTAPAEAASRWSTEATGLACSRCPRRRNAPMPAVDRSPTSAAGAAP